MRHRVVLSGGSAAFTVGLKSVIEDCGFDVVLEGASAPDEGDLIIYEVAGAVDIKRLPRSDSPAPYIVYAPTGLGPGEMKGLKDTGLTGVIRKDSTPEEISFLINSAIFHKKVIHRNARAAVNIAVDVRSGQRSMKTYASLLSRDGMFIVTLNPLPVGSLCEVSFVLPGEGAFSTEAKVLYNMEVNRDLSIISKPDDPFKRLVTHPGMAVFFTGLPGDKRDAIDRYVRSAG